MSTISGNDSVARHGGLIAEAHAVSPPEHKEEEHVSQEVQPSPVQEHGNGDADEKPRGCQVCEPTARDISRRDGSKDKKQSVNIWAVRKFKEEDPYIRDDDDE